MSQVKTAHDLHSSDARPAKEIKKLDSDGNYTPFEGLTIVMQIYEQDLKFGERLFKDLESTVPKKAHSLLPYQSYHVTLCGLVCRNHFESCQDYNNFIDEHYENLKKLQQELDQICGNSQMTYRVDTETMKKSSLSKLTGHLLVRNNDSAELLNKCFEKCKEILKIDLRMSEAHLSLAYPPPKGKKMNAEQRKTVQQVMDKHFDSSCVLVFERPRICFFKDMCEFIPIFN